MNRRQEEKQETGRIFIRFFQTNSLRFHWKGCSEGKRPKNMVGKKANSWLSSVASSLDKMGMREQGQDILKRAESQPA